MDRRRAGLAVALLLAAGLARAATQGPPVYAYTGAAPSGSCTGTRVWIDALGSGTYYCNAGTWAAASAGGGGAPTTAQYWTGAADGTLSAEKNLGALTTGLVLNTAGVPSAYAGASCTLPQLMQNLSASGAPTCFQLRLDQLANPTADIEWVFTGEKVLWDFQDPVDSGFSIHGTEAFLGDLVHIHQHSGNPPAGTDLLHIEATDPDVTGLRISMASSAHHAATITGQVDVTGDVAATSFTGPLAGNATTATALAADPGDCTPGQAATGINASGTATGCFTPSGGGGSVDARGFLTVFGGF